MQVSKFSIDPKYQTVRKESTFSSTALNTQPLW